MTSKKMFGPTLVTALLMFALAFLFVQPWGTQFREAMRGIAVLAIYGTLILSYLLSIATIVFGLFALYRALWIHVNGQNYKQVEV